jgi:hypothetical protein
MLALNLIDSLIECCRDNKWSSGVSISSFIGQTFHANSQLIRNVFVAFGAADNIIVNNSRGPTLLLRHHFYGRAWSNILEDEASAYFDFAFDATVNSQVTPCRHALHIMCLTSRIPEYYIRVHCSTRVVGKAERQRRRIAASNATTPYKPKSKVVYVCVADITTHQCGSSWLRAPEGLGF